MALEKLYYLRSIDEESKLTSPTGMILAESCSVIENPFLLKFLLEALKMFFKEKLCGRDTGNVILDQAITIISLLSLNKLTPFVHPKTKNQSIRLLACKQSLGVLEGDFISLLNVYSQWEHYKDHHHDTYRDSTTSSGKKKQEGIFKIALY